MQNLKNDQYCHVKNFKELISFTDDESLTFKDYWNRLVLDKNFEDYTLRKRRILKFKYKLHQEMILDKTSEYTSAVIYDIKYKSGKNQLTYVEDSFIQNNLMQKIIKTDLLISEDLMDKNAIYDINIHLFRVEAHDGKISPTTSGVHQDGVDIIHMHFINADNTDPVVSSLYSNKSSDTSILSTTMKNFLETLTVNDRVLYHSATPVRQLDLSKPAFRDLLLVTLMKV